MFEGKRIVIIDDDTAILNAFKKWFKKVAPNNDVILDDGYIKDSIDGSVDAVIVDYYLNRNQTAPDIIKEIRKDHPDILIIAMSGMFVEKFDEVTCYNIPIMKEVMMCGANRVCTKITNEIMDILRIHFSIRAED
jgi:DNA-binding response OmpR family regulator